MQFSRGTTTSPMTEYFSVHLKQAAPRLHTQMNAYIKRQSEYSERALSIPLSTFAQNCVRTRGVGT